jgi:hypothetical protein
MPRSIDPKIDWTIAHSSVNSDGGSAWALGHTLDVDLNVYTLPNLARRQEAANMLETAVQNIANFLLRYFAVHRFYLGCSLLILRAGDGDRTRDVHVGKLDSN